LEVKTSLTEHLKKGNNGEKGEEVKLYISEWKVDSEAKEGVTECF
jgi:hypothetical protein